MRSSKKTSIYFNFYSVLERAEFNKQTNATICLVWSGQYFPLYINVLLFEYFYLALINRAGGLYGRIVTEVVSTDRTQ